MKLGILNALTPQDEAQFDQSEFGIFEDFFRLADHNMTLVEYRVTEGEFPSSPNECDAFLITGSPKGVYDEEAWIGQLFDFVRASHAQEKALVGICFGHQSLAHSLGGRAEKSDKGWGIGCQQVEVAEQLPWMNPPLPSGSFYFCHQDQVTKLPKGAKLLAGNEFCPNAMFVIDDRVLGLQAHPEFTHDFMQKLFDWLRPNLDKEWLDGVESATAEKEVDNAVMVQWIVNFLVRATNGLQN